MKKRVAILLALIMVLGCMSGCGKKTETNVKSEVNNNLVDNDDPEKNEGTEQNVKPSTYQFSSGETLTFTDDAEPNSNSVIEYTMISGMTGEDEAAPYFASAIERFNEIFDGKFHIKLEGTTNYEDKMEQLIMSDNTPTVYLFEYTDFTKQNIIPNKLYYNMSDYLEKNKWILDMCPDSAVEYVKNKENGDFICSPNPIVSTTGVWYNDAKYQPSKNIANMTWDEFITDLGENKLALQTGDGCYQIDLLIPALLTEEEGGVEMMEAAKLENVSDFSTEMWKNVFQRVKDIYNSVGWQGGIGDNYAAAANSLFSNESSIIFNGIWLTSNLIEDASSYWSNGFNGANMEVQMYPNNVAVGNPDKFAWFINPKVDSEQLALAEAWIAFYYSQDELEERLLALGGQAPNVKEYSEDFKNKLESNKWVSQMTNAVNEDTTIVPEFYYFCTNASMVEMSKLLPSLLDETLSVDEFCEIMTEKAKDALDE